MRILALVAAGVGVAGLAYAAKPVGAPPSTPAEQAWFQQAFIPGMGGCCSEADGFREGMEYPADHGLGGHQHPGGIILKAWRETDNPEKPYQILIEIEPDKYNWMDVEKYKVLPPKPPNPTGGAVAFLVFNYVYETIGNSYSGGQQSSKTERYSVFLRCFAPGNQF